MSNYTKENLIQIPQTAVPAGTLAMKVGNEIFTPGNIRISSGGSIDFYKCASVDTTTKTWSGYKAVLTDGAYSFDGVATEGLTYGNGLSPVVDGIYDAEALVYVNRLWLGAAAVNEGLVIHVPLQHRAETAETGHVITYSHENITFGVVSNVTCATLNQNGIGIRVAEDIPVRLNPITLSYWVKYMSPQSDIYVGWENWNGYYLHAGRNGNGTMYVDGAENWSWADNSNIAVTDNEWHHVCLVWDSDNTEYILYLDGREIMRNTKTDGPRAGEGTADEIEICGIAGTSFADIRIYNRPLSPEEVSLLATNMP